MNLRYFLSGTVHASRSQYQTQWNSTYHLLPRSNSIKVGRETTYDLSRLDGVNISDIRSSTSQDDDIHYSISSRVAMASASSTSRSRSKSKSTLVGHSDHGVGVRMLGTLNVPSRHGKAAAAQEHVDSISNGEVHV